MPEEGDRQPLSEDYALCGLLWEDSLPEHWIDDQEFHDEGKEENRPSMNTQRKGRVRWHALRQVEAGLWLQFDKEKRRFTTVGLRTDRRSCVDGHAIPKHSVMYHKSPVNFRDCLGFNLSTMKIFNAQSCAYF